MKLPLTLLSVLMAGGLIAQTTAPAPSAPKNHAAAANRSGWMVRRLTNRLNLTRLNLTGDQQAKVQAIFADSRQQLREEHSATRG